MSTFGDEATTLRSVPHHGIIKFALHAVIFFIVLQSQIFGRNCSFGGLPGQQAYVRK